MTKNVRIENADTAKYRVVVEVWDRVKKVGPEETEINWELTETIKLNNPTDLLTKAVWGGRELRIREEAI